MELSKKIFISYSSSDHGIITSFINNILCNGLCLDRNSDIFCTAIHGSDIKSGHDFKIKIKSELENAKAIIQILSPNYKKSEVCLNEMGAAWVLNSCVIPFTVPPIGYDVGFIHANTQQLRLNVKEDLLKFYDDYKTELFLKDISIANYIVQIDKFICDLESLLDINDNKGIYFYDENIKLEGVLEEGVFSGPPWGEENLNNVSFHKYHFIQLQTPITVLNTSYPTEENDRINHFDVERLQLFGDNDKYRELDLSPYVNKKIRLIGTFMQGHTAWHRTEVLFCFVYLEIL